MRRWKCFKCKKDKQTCSKPDEIIFLKMGIHKILQALLNIIRCAHINQFSSAFISHFIDVEQVICLQYFDSTFCLSIIKTNSYSIVSLHARSIMPHDMDNVYHLHSDFTSRDSFVWCSESFPIDADITAEHDVHQISCGSENLSCRLLVTKLSQPWCWSITTSINLNITM